MKVLFVIKTIDYGDYGSIGYLSSIAKEAGFETYLCVMDFHNIFDMVSEIKPDIVAYSANILGYSSMVDANKMLKENNKFISIMGGPHPTFNPGLFNESSMDAFCVGEGELPFREFLEKVKNSDSFDNIENLITKNKINPVRNLIADLDDIPHPDRDIVLCNTFVGMSSKKTFFTSRGCPFSCSYCCNNYYNEMYRGKGKIVRRFSVDRVIEEMENVKKKYNMDFIKIGDDLFAYKYDEWLEEFSKKYKEKIGVPFNCYLRLDSINEKLISTLKNAGCHSVHLSIDSCSERIRNDILRRKWKNVNIEDNIKLIHKYGIKTWVNFMLAIPESTTQDDLNALYFGHNNGITYSSFSTTVPIKGTGLFDYCVDKGYIDNNYDGYLKHTYLSELNCFSQRDKEIRSNIYNLGPMVSRLPSPLFEIGILIIKHCKPFNIFNKIKDIYLGYMRDNIIFKIDKKKEKKNAGRKDISS